MDRILIVDDDESLLTLLTRQLRDAYEVVTAKSAEEALSLLESSSQFVLVLSDLELPGASGNTFLAAVRDKYPSIIRIMLTGQANLDAAIDAINTGAVFRFLTKPADSSTLLSILQTAANQYRLIQAEKELLEKTLSGSVKVLTDVLSLSSGAAYGRVARLRQTVRAMQRSVQAQPPWVIELSAMLSQIGCIGVPQDILSRAVSGQELKPADLEVYSMFPVYGHDLIVNIPRLADVARTVKYQLKNYDGSGYPADEVNGEAIPVGSRLLRVALEYDVLTQRGKSPQVALLELRRSAALYWPSALQAISEVIEAETGEAVRIVSLEELRDGMLLAEDVFTADGTLLAGRGLEVSSSLRVRLQTLRGMHQVRVQMPPRVGA